MELARTVRQDPITNLEAARRPYFFTLPPQAGSSFKGFVTRSKAIRSQAYVKYTCQRRAALVRAYYRLEEEGFLLELAEDS
jgi:hypothetical protein